MSGLTEDERRDLLRAWPWPQEAATTRDGFAEVCAVVERIKADAVPRESLEEVVGWLESERDRIRQAYREHNMGRAEGRPIKRPDLDTWANAYEVAARRVRAILSALREEVE